MRVLVAAASKHGSTGEIAESIAETLRIHGAEVETHPIGERSDAASFDAFVLGSAVYVGSWMKEAVSFVRDNRGAIDGKPVWLFSSGPLGEEVADLEQQPKELPELEGWIHPREHRTFFGALMKEKLGFGERMMVKAVKAPDGDFRDWDEIRRWAESIAASLS